MTARNDQEITNVRIPVSSIDDIARYQKSLINVLDKVEIDDCNPAFREDLAMVYRLLSLLTSAGDSIAQERVESENGLTNSLRKMTA